VAVKTAVASATVCYEHARVANRDEVVERLGVRGVSGMLSARLAGATLVSLDRRAAPTYQRCGVTFRLLSG